MSADLKAIYPRLATAVNNRDLDALDDLIHPAILNHGADPSDPPGAERFKRNFRTLIAAFPDFQIAVEDQIVEGDKVVVRWVDTGTHAGVFAGAMPTGKPLLLTGIDILRIADGKIVERWSEYDMLSVLEELGAIQRPEGV
jgi:predicted ester cyclase